MMRIKPWILLLLLTQSFIGNTKEYNNLDSLETLLPLMKEDSAKADIYADLAYNYRKSNPKKAHDYVDRGIIIAQKIGSDALFCKALSIKGYILAFQGEYELAMTYLLQSEQIAVQINDERRLSYIYSDIAIIYSNSGEYSRSEEFYKKALSFANKNNYQDRLAIIFNNLGELEKNRENYELALNYQVKAMESKKSIGLNYTMQVHNIGTIYYQMKNYDRALKFLKQAQKEAEGQRENSSLLCENYLYIGKSYLQFKQQDSAEIYLLKALDLAKKLQDREALKFAYFELASLKKLQGDNKKALFYQDEYINVKKELDENGALLSIISNYENAQKEKEIQLLQEQQKLQEIELDAKRMGQYAFGTIALLLAIFVGYGYNRFKIIRKQKGLIAIQRDNIEEKQKHFLQSLDYASIIQRSILPVKQRIDRAFDDHFVFFQPLHTVSGDFYYFMEKEDRIYISVADCTGHGVPGAFMSMIGYEIMNYIINTMNVAEPNRILARVNDRIYNTLKQDGKDGMDGMDLSLACIYKGQNKMDISCAGSNVFIYNKERKDGILEMQKNKFGVGSKFNREVKYTQQTVELIAGDVIYMSSDGYVDQFGGPSGKKLKTIQLKKLLAEIFEKPGEEQLDIIASTFNNWKGNVEQIDDVTLFGFAPKIVTFKSGKLSSNDKSIITEAMNKLSKVDLEIEISDAIEIIEQIEINHKDWSEMYEELTELILSMDKDAVLKRIKEIQEDL